LNGSPQGELAVASVQNFVWPDKLSQSEESVKAREKLGEKENVVMGIRMG
jgi:hypothetical protein